ncbi:MAG: ribosome silencing factor [Bacteroidales bacterium]
MVNEKVLEVTDVLKTEIINGIQEKKGKEIVCLNLAKINSTVCDYFVICHGTSNTHVSSIADAVEETVKKHTGVKPRRREGFANAEWLLLDYLDVVVHIFQEDIRNYYRIEDLWADAPAEYIDVDS